MQERPKIANTIAVIAANGRTGQAFVAAALRAGMIVRAGYHGSNVLPEHERLTSMKCDATNKTDLYALLEGANVVVSLIGHVKGSPAHVQADAMKVLIPTMRELSITRIVSLTGTGVRQPGDRPSLLDRMMNAAITIIDPERVADGKAHAELLMESGLDWTIIRVLKLTNGAHVGKVIFSLNGPAELFTPRARVAAAIMWIIETGEYVRTMPIISGKVL